MKGKRYTTEDKVRILREADRGQRTIQVICREANISEVTFHRWKKQFGQMEVNEAHRLIMLWKLHALHRKFLSMSPEQFLAKVNRLDTHLDGMKEVDFTYMGMIASRENMAGDLNLDYQRIVSIIWGDEEFGPFSEFLRGLGYKTLSEYNSPRSDNSPLLSGTAPDNVALPPPSGILPPDNQAAA